MIGVEIDIAFYTDEELELKELNLEISNKIELWEKRTFYTIDWVMEDRGDKRYSNFGSAGDSFVTNTSYKDFKQMLAIARTR
jgi:hypothetical protein